MDPISNMITMMRNAASAGKPRITIPFSNVKHAIAEVLLKEGYVASVSVSNEPKKNIEVVLAVGDKKAKISGIDRISKPSRRVYMPVSKLQPVKNGFGRLIISTPKGIMTDKEAKKELVGGEVLFAIW